MNRLVAVSGLCLLLSACASQPPTPTVPMPPPPPSGEPAGVVGLSSSNVREAFGAPTFVHKENGSEMWRYDSGACRVFFFLYPQGASQVVRHVETVPHGKDIAADAKCLAALRGKPPAS